MPDLSIATGLTTNTLTSTPGGPGNAVLGQDPTSIPDDRDFISAAKERFQVYVTAWSEIRHQANEDQRFWAGQQWDPQIMNDRASTGRPCLVINRLQQFTKQVTNEQRQNRPAIQINPVDDSTTDDAEILEGMVRHIQVDSEADAAYDTANQHQTSFGFGFIRVLTEYTNDYSLDQKIVIKRVKDPFKHYPDPNCQELDFSDSRGWFVFEDLPINEYRAAYPNSSLASMNDFVGEGDTIWYPEQKIRVCEYFWVDLVDVVLVQWADGTVHTKDKTPPQQLADALRPPVKVKKRVVHWVKMNGVEILEGRVPPTKDNTSGYKVLPGPYIPVVPVLGDEVIVDGRTYYAGMVRYAKDAQRQYNYMRTAVVESIALAPKAPFIMAEGQDENHEDDWKQANIRPLSRLIYKPVALGNQLAPPPQRNQAEAPIAAMTQALSQAEHDLMAVMGIYQSGLGQTGPEQSGKAILARQSKGETANFNYSDNVARAMRQLGRIILSWIPHYYDIPRMVDIVYPDGNHAVVPGNQPFMKSPDGSTKPATQNDIQKSQQPGYAGPKIKMHDLVNFRGTVTISTGPSYQTKRQEAVQSILALVQAFPQIMQVAGDLLVGWMDWNGAKEVAARLKIMLPPGITSAEDDGEMTPAKFAQLSAQFSALQQQFQAMQIKQATKAPELALKKYLGELQADTQIRVAEVNAKIADGERTANQIEQIIDLGREAQSQAQQDAQATQLQQMSQAHEAALAGQQHQHSLELAQQQAALQPPTEPS